MLPIFTNFIKKKISYIMMIFFNLNNLYESIKLYFVVFKTLTIRTQLYIFILLLYFN